jgi:cell division protein FtsW
MAVKNNILYMKNSAPPMRRAVPRPAAAPLKKGMPDMWLFLIILFLVGIGVIMVFSASYYDTLSSDPFEYLKRQSVFAAVGLVVMLLAMNVDYRKLRFLSKPLMYGTIILLAAVFLFDDTKGSYRWIPLGPINLQPSEVAKFTLALFMADRLGRRNADPNDLTGALGNVTIMLGIAAFLIYKEPDLGATVTLACIAMIILISAGTRWLYMIGTLVLGGAAIAVRMTSNVYQMRRIWGYLDPWSDPVDTGFQIINSYYALGSGGFWGAGVGGSRQKLGFLPEQSTDFIFSIAGEELGFIGAGFIVVLFLLLAWRGYRIAIRCPDRYGSLLAVGLTTSLALQAALNLGVVTGALPVSGIALPFISYGGSSLLMSMGTMGVLLNISRYRSG